MPKFPVWDLPTRLFHWILVLLFAASWLSIEILDDPELHETFGIAALTLLVFRVIWGFFGSVHSRFSDFFPSVATLKSYLQTRQWTRQGHNPLGALSVLALLFFMLVQGITGLFTSDDIFYDGPLSALVGSDTAELLTSIHVINFNILLGLVALHVIAIVIYRLRGKNLIQPMVSGFSEAGSGAAAPRPWWLGAIALGVSVTIVLGLLQVFGS